MEEMDPQEQLATLRQYQSHLIPATRHLDDARKSRHWYLNCRREEITKYRNRTQKLANSVSIDIASTTMTDPVSRLGLVAKCHKRRL